MQLNVKNLLALAASFALVGSSTSTYVPPSINLPTPTVQSCLAYSTLNNLPTPVVPFQACNTPLSERYVARSTLNNIIEEQFCPDAVKMQPFPPEMNTIRRLYNNGTPEHVAISINWANKPNKSNFKLDLHECLRFLRDMVLDGCNGNDPNNPMNWKGGGLLRADGATYKIEPLSQRQPFPKEPSGLCKVTHANPYHHVVIQGIGWANSDWGKMLEDKLCDCDLLPDTFHFTYELGYKGREWNATMYTTTWKENCIVGAAKQAGASNSFKCDASA
ncbi:hypothetical protein ACJ73_05103 [Blastomyces percursus]|uniref:Ecp2 effector protein domain-containing protein n=1 Tax=Blastomyces percursus TaxID=1658174 RepID=A0A1J9Q621_9EURO|nr:hypothetical protein ACJ73_05103 [Blastomyces percursus]